jgi:hypothetical protein
MTLTFPPTLQQITETIVVLIIIFLTRAAAIKEVDIGSVAQILRG